MKIYYDAEFLEDGCTIDLISIGMIAEDGRELYCINRNAPWDRIRSHEWLMTNVAPALPRLDDPEVTSRGTWMLDDGHRDVYPQFVISELVHCFIRDTPDPELWAWYAAFDHVALAQLFGPMSDLPAGIPTWTNDLRQEAWRLGDPPLPEQADGEHHALADARHNMARDIHLTLVRGTFGHP